MSSGDTAATRNSLTITNIYGEDKRIEKAEMCSLKWQTEYILTSCCLCFNCLISSSSFFFCSSYDGKAEAIINEWEFSINSSPWKTNRKRYNRFWFIPSRNSLGSTTYFRKNKYRTWLLTKQRLPKRFIPFLRSSLCRCSSK